MNESRVDRMARRKFFGFSSELWAWVVYDLANTIFSAIFISITFPQFIKHYVGGTERDIGIVNAIACLAAAVLVPVLGSISDRTGRRLPMLIVFTLMCCVLAPFGTVLPTLVGAAFIGGLALFAYYAGLSLYDAILPDVASSSKQGIASGLGVGVGYGGTIIAIACSAPMFILFDLDEKVSLGLLNWMVGILFLLFAIPLFVLHKETRIAAPMKLKDSVIDGLQRVREGAKLATRPLWIYLWSSFFYANAAMAIIYFFNLYATEELGIPLAQFMIIYAGLAASAMVWSIIGGYAVDRLGARKVLFFAGFFWIAIIIFMMFIQTVTGFVIAGLAGGAALGLVWTASRPLLVRLSDPDRMGESFGFLNFAGRTSTIVGPLVFGDLVTRYNYDWALGALIAFFVIGIGLLKLVPAQLVDGIADATA